MTFETQERSLKKVMIAPDPTMQQLQQYTAVLSNNIAIAAEMVARLKNEEAAKKRAEKIALAKATIKYKDEKNAKIMTARAELDGEVQKAGQELLEASAKALLAAAMLQGYDAQYTAAKKIIEARIREIRGGVG